MRSILLLLASFLILTADPAFAAGKKARSATGVTEASVTAAVADFVDSLNSLDDERVLSALSSADRLALRGRPNLIGEVYGRKLVSPSVKSFEKVMDGGKLVGAMAVVVVEEVDPISSVRVPKEKTWFLSLDGNVLKVSVASVWLDSGMVKDPE